MAGKSQFRNLFIILLLLSFSGTLFAQFTGGGRAGVNLSNLRGESVKNNKMLVGYNVGGFINYSMIDLLTGDLAEIMSLQAELTVQTKGAKLEYSTLDQNNEPVTETTDQVFTYVQVPVLAKFTFSPSRTFSYFGEGGFYLSSLFGLTVDGEKSWNHDNDPSTDTRKYREEYSGFDAGVVIGGGASMPFGGRNTPWKAFGAVRYSLGLMNIGEAKDNTPEVLLESLEDVKTSAISILLGVTYQF